MKKIFMLIVACVATLSVFSQTVVESSMLENTYVGVSAGSFGWVQPQTNGYQNFIKSNRGTASIRFGKYITPIVGVEVEGSVGMANRSTFIDHSNVSFNGLLNLNNAFHGYQGKCDKLEVVPFVGMGWIHTYGYVSNNISAKGGVQFNWNISSNGAWQVNCIPSITYALTNNGVGTMSDATFTSERAFVSLQVGVTYKFKNKKGTHNFVKCPNVYTQSQWDDMTTALRKLAQDKQQSEQYVLLLSKIVMNQKEVIKELQSRPLEITRSNSAIGFEIGSCNLLSTSKANLITLANAIKNENTQVVIKGYADAQTGSSKRNLELSQLRSQTIKTFLVNEGIDESRIKVVAKGDNEQIFGENELNRVVIIEVK